MFNMPKIKSFTKTYKYNIIKTTIKNIKLNHFNLFRLKNIVKLFYYE